MTAVRQPPGAAAALIQRAAELIKTSANLGNTGRSLSQLEAIAEAVAAERERIAQRVSERVIVRLSVGRDPLVEVNEIIQDLAHDIATDWEDYE
jgi:cystathionine beta-lyase/cystathionine gamma-synthase